MPVSEWGRLMDKRGLAQSSRKPCDEDDDPLAALEVPNSWMALGLGVSAIGCIAILQIEWGVAWYWGVLAVLLSFVLGEGLFRRRVPVGVKTDA